MYNVVVSCDAHATVKLVTGGCQYDAHKVSTHQDYSLNHVIEGSVLRNSDKSRLVVRRSVDRRKTVRALRETARDDRGEHAVLRGVVEALEEDELARVRHLRRLERRDLLDDDVRVALDVALRVHLLRRGEVVVVRVHEVARLEVVDRHLDREVLVRGHLAVVRREDELGRGHVRRRRDDPHRRRVARARLDLLPVRDREVRDRRAEVDEVVRRGERGDLARLGLCLAVLLEALRDHGVEERQRRLWVIAVVSTRARLGVVAALCSGLRKRVSAYLSIRLL